MKLLELLELQVAGMRAGKEMTAVTIVTAGEGTTRTRGKMLVFGDGTTEGTIGGGAVERRAVADALEVLRTRENRVETYDPAAPAPGGGPACGGRLTVFLEYVRDESPQLIVVGGGHVGTALIRLARPAGFTVTLLDIRGEDQIGEAVALADRFVPIGDFRGGVSDYRAPAGAFYVVATFGHASDGDALGGALAHMGDAAYIGMIGSRKKVRALFDRLEGEGYDRSLLDRVHSPIGLDLGGETPEEIAVAILAEMIRVKNRGDGRPI